MLLPITGLYAGLIALLTLYLMVHVIAFRGKENLSLGDGGSAEMIARIRRHGNLVESSALMLILMAIIEANDAPGMFVHTVGLIYLIARIAHPLGLGASKTTGFPRVAGTLGTLLAILAAAGMAIWQYVQAMTAG